MVYNNRSFYFSDSNFYNNDMSVVVGIRKEASVHFACDGQNTSDRAHFSEQSKWVTFGEKGNQVLIAITGDTFVRHHIEFSFAFTQEPTYENIVAWVWLLQEKLGDRKFSLLIGGSGNLFRVSNYEVVIVEEYEAIGSGAQVAVGSLYSTPEVPPQLRAEKAVRAAVKWIPSCGGKIFKERI